MPRNVVEICSNVARNPLAQFENFCLIAPNSTSTQTEYSIVTFDYIVYFHVVSLILAVQNRTYIHTHNLLMSGIRRTAFNVLNRHINSKSVIKTKAFQYSDKLC